MASLDQGFVITRDWLHQHATEGHGWTKAQLKVLGIDWPPIKGWLSGMVGAVITDDERRAFETARNVRY